MERNEERRRERREKEEERENKELEGEKKKRVGVLVEGESNQTRIIVKWGQFWIHTILTAILCASYTKGIKSIITASARMGRFVIMLWSYGAGIWTSVRFGADTVSWGFYLDKVWLKIWRRAGNESACLQPALNFWFLLLVWLLNCLNFIQAYTTEKSRSRISPPELWSPPSPQAPPHQRHWSTVLFILQSTLDESTDQYQWECN